MDSEELSSLIILGIVCVVSFIKSLRKNIRRESAAKPGRVLPRPNDVSAHQHISGSGRQPAEEPASAMPIPEACVQIRKPGTGQFLSGEEGVRVTEDTPEQPSCIQTGTEGGISREELRKAVIWSEILTPKFKTPFR